MSSLMSSSAPQTLTEQRIKERIASQGKPATAIRQIPSRIDGAHEAPAAPKVHVQASHPAAFTRQRFYPAQLRRLVRPELQPLAASRNHQLNWMGWDRSLPRMYLPVEALVSLLVEAVDGITRAVEPSGGRAPSIGVRVESQGTSNQSLLIALDADHWQCDEKFRGALNAYWLRQGGQSQLWQRLARQCDLVGGWLSVADLPGGGASLRINLPTDQPRALVHSWLNRLVCAGQGMQRFSLSLHAIGRSQSESLEQLQAANVRLQLLAGAEDYIYRAGHGRWIWLTTQPQLPAFLNAAAWQRQLLDRWTCEANSAAISDIACRIQQRFGQLLGMRVPPVDLRTHMLSLGPITTQRPQSRVDKAASIYGSHHLDQPTHARVNSLANVRSRLSSQAQDGQPKWRYPI